MSPLGGLKGAAGYHTSVLVAGEEYSFCPAGISCARGLTSHKGSSQVRCIDMGLSEFSGAEMFRFLEFYFPPGSYDLLKRNCNSFSDCALYFLCEQRLHWGLCGLERLGKVADNHIGLIQSLSGGEYIPNPLCANFDVEDVIAAIDVLRDPNIRTGACNVIDIDQIGVIVDVDVMRDPNIQAVGGNAIDEMGDHVDIDEMRDVGDVIAAINSHANQEVPRARAGDNSNHRDMITAWI